MRASAAGQGDAPMQHATWREAWLPAGCVLLCLLVSLYVSVALPLPLDADAQPTVFSEARARAYLDGLLALGPYRTVGSRINEELAPKFLEDTVAQIKTGSMVTIKTQRHVGSGNFSLDFLGGFHNVYHNVQNVLVLVEGKRPPEDGVLMLSAHYDTAVGVHGASDNGANVAILLETLRVLSSRPVLPFSVLFVFNGAEETILQGSHSLLVNRHPWMRNVKAFINLEAAGASGREMMFQAGEGMVEVYARGAPWPHASVLAQDVFQSGVIPSDTDFRVYIGLADPNANPNPYPNKFPFPYLTPLPGLDMANIHNGQVYHTKLDNAAHVHPGALQRYGDNILGMVLAVDSLPPPHPNAPVFFDVLGIFVVRLSGPMCALLSLLGVVITAQLWRISWPLLDVHSGALNLMHMLAGALGKPLLTSVFLAMFAPLSYYRALWLALPLYVFPAAVGMIQSHARLPAASMIKDKLHGHSAELSAFCAATALYFVLFVLLAAAGKGSAYLPWCFAVLPASARLAVAMANGGDVSGKRAALLSGSLGCVVPLLLATPPLFVVFAIFLPITGRSGTIVPGDVIVCVLSVLGTYFALLVPCALLHVMPKPAVAMVVRLLRGAWMLAIAWAVLINTVSTGGYSATHPKRVYAIETHRVSANEQSDSFLWIIGADASGLGRVVANVPGVEWVDCTKEARVYCGLPWYLPMMKEIPVSAIVRSSPGAGERGVGSSDTCAMRVVRSEPSPDGHSRRVFLRISGVSDHFTLYLPSRSRGGPSRWSYSAQPLPEWNGHVYTSFASGVKVPEAVDFWVDVDGKFKASLACHYLEEPLSANVVKLLELMPQGWLDVISFVSRMREYEF